MQSPKDVIFSCMNADTAFSCDLWRCVLPNMHMVDTTYQTEKCKYSTADRPHISMVASRDDQEIVIVVQYL